MLVLWGALWIAAIMRETDETRRGEKEMREKRRRKNGEHGTAEEEKRRGEERRRSTFCTIPGPPASDLDYSVP